MQEFKDTLYGLILPVVLGIAGGSVRAIRFGVKSWRQFAGSLVVACFVAVLVNWLLEAAPELSAGVKSGIIGICAYSGGSVLDALHAKFMRRLDGDKAGEAGAGVAGAGVAGAGVAGTGVAGAGTAGGDAVRGGSGWSGGSGGSGRGA